MRKHGKLEAAPARSQDQIMDEDWLYLLVQQIMGECKFTAKKTFQRDLKKFVKDVFQDVLHRTARMNPRTLGKILAHGLAPGESHYYRITPMCDGWLGSVENTSSGIMLLEWSATAVIVAAIYDLLYEDRHRQLEKEYPDCSDDLSDSHLSGF